MIFVRDSDNPLAGMGHRWQCHDRSFRQCHPRRRQTMGERFCNHPCRGLTSQLTQLTDGSFYRGFMTIDLVTASTALLPTDGAYPFYSFNCLTGQTYYVRLLEGAANGIQWSISRAEFPPVSVGLILRPGSMTSWTTGRRLTLTHAIMHIRAQRVGRRRGPKRQDRLHP